MNRQDRLQQRVIERLIELHQVNHSKIELKNQDRKQAIYFLQGSAITSAINARKLKNEVGMLGREWRYISELTYAVEYFDELGDDSREIAAWFNKNGFVERKAKKGKIDSAKRQQKSQLHQSHFELYDKLHGKINHELSQFAHATYKSTRGNTRKHSKIFDYYHSYDDDPTSLIQLKGVFVSEAISCFLLPVWSLPIDEDPYTELLEYKTLLNDYFAELSSLSA